MSLLTPSESHAFQSFLSSVDSNNNDWNDNMQQVPEMHGSESLAKATKELMTLDAGRWDQQPQPPSLNYNYDYYYGRYEHQYQNVTFPVLAQKQQQPQPQLHHHHHHQHQHHPQPSYHVTQPHHHRQPPQKRQLDSASMPISKRSRPSPPLPPTPISAAHSTKPALLSPSQKKANHIQSEQKRRANIRRGYEALCDSVPALREAIRLEEEAQAIGKEKAKSKKAKSKAKADDAAAAAADKIDGRAGPRSENVVLVKTIEYINDLHSERSQLLARLQAGRALLPPGHPAQFSAVPLPLWEREWKGGEDTNETEPDEEGEEDGE